MPTLDRTEIVNLMLAAVGESEVSSGEVTTPTMPEVKKAVRVLDKVDRAVQLGAWSFTRDIDVELTPVAGEITLAAGVVAVEAIDRTHLLGIVNGKLYDRLENTFTFGGKVRVNTVTQRTFSYLPMHALNLIMARAIREFAEWYLGEPNGALREDEVRANHEFHNTEMELADYWLSDAPDVGRAFMRQPPLPQPHA